MSSASWVNEVVVAPTTLLHSSSEGVVLEVDDGGFVLENRDELILGIPLIGPHVRPVFLLDEISARSSVFMTNSWGSKYLYTDCENVVSFHAKNTRPPSRGTQNQASRERSSLAEGGLSTAIAAGSGTASEGSARGREAEVTYSHRGK
jgi:hypothetical protein